MIAASGGPTVAVLGCGRWGVHIVRDLLTLGCTVVVVDPTAAGRERGEQAGALAAPSLQQAGQLAAIDGAVVAAPTRLHVELAFAAADMGLPVFVEKPLSADVLAARRLVAAHGQRVFVMHKWHYHPGVEALAAAVGSGRLGTLVTIQSERLGSSVPATDIDDEWLLAPHELSIGRSIVGSWPQRTSGRMIESSGGIDLVAESSWASGPLHRWRVCTAPGPVTRTITVMGTRGRAVLDGAYAAHVQFDDELLEVSAEYPLVRELRVFRDYLLGGAPPATTAADGLAVVEIIAALHSTMTT
ncbi:MAG: Gfo/Idh/MocA family oxidoreductase [Actinomycetota bacterium]|nr:Gfo/Idh/MocA family oxidoreductase [Actinomycetota bacterium]